MIRFEADPSYDILLLDVNLPMFTGPKLIKGLRQKHDEEVDGDFPIIILYSAMEYDRLHETALEFRADGWISKDVSIRDFFTHVDNIVHNTRIMREYIKSLRQSQQEGEYPVLSDLLQRSLP